MSILAKYVNCSVVEGSISITSAIYNDQDTNYSMPNLTEVLLPAATSSPQKFHILLAKCTAISWY